MAIALVYNAIFKALIALGYSDFSDKINIIPCGIDRYTVLLDGARIGIFDLQRNTFVD